MAWTTSRVKALVAAGIPVPAVEYGGVTYQIGQANNALVYPGLGLGTILAGASRVTPGMLVAAAQAVAGQVDPRAPGASLLPAVQDLRESSAITAAAVARAAASEGVATRRPADPLQAARDAMWQPVYSSDPR
jgi:malate dehydrogenase (oxaloacetate-decarboxylating)